MGSFLLPFPPSLLNLLSSLARPSATIPLYISIHHPPSHTYLPSPFTYLFTVPHRRLSNITILPVSLPRPLLFPFSTLPPLSYIYLALTPTQCARATSYAPEMPTVFNAQSCAEAWGADWAGAKCRAVQLCVGPLEGYFTRC